jgi:hypothetical protein
VSRYVAALAPGSCLVVSIGRGEGDEASQAFGAYSSAGIAIYNYSVAVFSGFFDGLTMVDPGVVDARLWRPDVELSGPIQRRTGQYLVGVARVG